MKIFHLPAEIKALAFDMDLTLYTNHEYALYQIDSLVEKLGKMRGLSFEKMNSEVEESRRAWTLSNNGETPSLSKILNGYGITTEQIVLWRNEIFEPRHFIKKDLKLKQTLDELSKYYALGIVTNNPVLVAHKTLAALGVDECFPVIVGIDTCMIAKPHKMPYMKFIELSKSVADTCVSIGDRYDVDLDIPLKMGMGGILVDGVKDVYMLPGILMERS